MLLAIDIGNTTISCAIIYDRKIIEKFFLESRLSKAMLRKELNTYFKRVKRSFSKINQIIICSVVPDVTKIVESQAKQKLNMPLIVVGRDRQVPLKNNYQNPKQVGQDRLVCAYAAKIMYGFPAIVIDFGTATTFEVINKKGEYDGGLIVPGIRLSAESLFNKTALLPKIENIKAPRNLIGRNTQDSILSGLFYGYGTMCSGLIDMIEQKMKGRPKVIITGGYTTLMKKYIIDKIDIVDSDLVFKGLLLLEK
jgi:type III pantothenate kinase